MPGYEWLGEEERQALDTVFQNGAVLLRHGSDGRRNGVYMTRDLEAAFSEYVGTRFALAVTSATAGLKIALLALGVRPGDEVATQAFTFIATAEAIVDIGARPVIVNVDDTLNMDPADLAAKLTPRTAAVLPVHMLGVAADMDPIRAVASQHGVRLVEDVAEALGATYGGASLGSLSAVGVFSFGYNKTITCGEGGMLTTNDEALYRWAHEYHDHGHVNSPGVSRGQDPWRMVGFNYRMNELQAGVALAQLRKLDMLVETNRKHYAFLEQALMEVSGLGFRRIPDRCDPLCDTLIVTFPQPLQAQRFALGMGSGGVATKNLPDALGWHFAGSWNHLFERYGVAPEELERATAPSLRYLRRAVAVPVLLRQSSADLERTRDVLVRAAVAALA